MATRHFNHSTTMNAMNSKISVLIPAYNTGKYIAECIESVMAQTYRNLEIIVVDDGSTDDTITIAERYALNDNRVRVVAISHEGVSNARNVCLSNATGDYILFVDSDDWIGDNLCYNLLTSATRNDADIVFSSMTFIPKEGNPYIFGDRSDLFKDTEVLSGRDCFIKMVDAYCAYPMVAGNLYNRGFINDNGIVFKGEYHEDEYAFPFLLKYAKRVCSLRDAQYFYRERPKSIMNCASNFKDRALALGHIVNEFENELLTWNTTMEDNRFVNSVVKHIAGLRKKAQELYDIYISSSQKDLILFVVNQSPGLSYGLGTYTRAVFCAVNNMPEVDFVVLNLCCDVESVQFHVGEGCPFYLFPTIKDRGIYFKSVVYFIATRLLIERHIVVHLNYASQLPLAKFAKDILRAKILYTQHYMDWGINLGANKELLTKELENKDSDITRKFYDEKQMMSTCDRLIVTAAHSYHALKEIYGVDCSKIRIIPHAVSFTRPSSNIATLRTKYNLALNDRIILYVGRLDDNKNIRSLLKAFASINIPNVYLWIVGEGHLNLYLNEVEISDWKRIAFWGYRAPSVIYEMYTIAELGIVPSKYEEFGYVALEMMMSGLPVILNNTTGLRELAAISLMKTYDGSVESLIAQIKGSLQTPATLDVIKVMYHRLQQRYLPSLFKSRMAEMYSSLIS